MSRRGQKKNVIKWKSAGPNHNGLKAEKVKHDFPLQRQHLGKPEVKSQSTVGKMASRRWSQLVEMSKGKKKTSEEKG